MIALDTHALVRLLVMDDEEQAKKAALAVTEAEAGAEPILILPEVLIETSWVLEAVYRCERVELVGFLERLLSVPAFTFLDPAVVKQAVARFKKGGDFADHMIVEQARKQQARKLISFDKKLHNIYPDYATDS